jgi:hypothetical protein
MTTSLTTLIAETTSTTTITSVKYENETSTHGHGHGLSEEELYSRISPVACYQLNFITLYCFILFISSLFFNTILLRTFYKYKELRTTLNVFVIVLTAINLIGSCSELPLVMATNWYCRSVNFKF